MKIAITSSGVNLDAPTSPISGCCPFNGGIVRDAVEGFRAGKLESVVAANAKPGQA